MLMRTNCQNKICLRTTLKFSLVWAQYIQKTPRWVAAIQSYIGTEVEQLLGETFVQLARGRDDYNHHFLIPRASGVMIDEEVNMWHAANRELVTGVRKVLYHDAEKLGKH